MKIVKYKKKTQGKYSVYLDDGREFVLYEDVILKHELLLRKEILEKDLDLIYQNNLELDVYYVALNSIKSRYRSVYDLKEFLIRKEYPSNYVDSAIEKLISQGYLNDQNFAKSYIHSQMNTTNHGPNRIRNDLANKHVSASIIEEEILCFTDEEQIEKMKKIIDYRLKINHTRTGNVLKRKIYNDLLMLGYDSELIEKAIQHYDFHNNQDLAKKEYDKLYKKYSRKYSGIELQRKIKEKLYLKGFTYEEE